jgi:hypothetical protein
VAGLVVLAFLLGPAAASSAGWSRVREAVADGRSPLSAVVVVATWVAIWLGGLLLVGVGAAFRSAAWTLEVSGRR